MNTEFNYSIFLDGKEFNNIPKHVAETIETLMSGGDVLFVKRNPEIIERNLSVNETNIDVLKEIRILNENIAASHLQLVEQANANLVKYSNEFNEVIAPVVKTINEIKNNPQEQDIASLNRALDNISSRINDISNNVHNFVPLLLRDNLNKQKEDIIESMIASLKPKEETEKSVEKGQNYENELTDTMRELTKRMGYDVQLVGREKDRACDIHVRDIDAKILYAVEAKNYSNTVPGKEVEKFYRDLELLKHDPEYAAYRIIGLFVSTSASIAGHGNFNIDESGNFFIAGENNNASMLLSIFMLCHRMAYNKKFNELEDNADSAEQRKKVILDVHNLLQKNTKMIKVINNQIKNANSIIKDAEDMKSLISPVNEILEEYVKEFELELKKKPHSKQNNKKRVTAMVETESATEEDTTEQEPTKKKSLYVKPKRKYTIKSAPIELESDEIVAEWE